MSWPNPYARSLDGLVDVKATFSRKRKSNHPSRHPPQNQSEGLSEVSIPKQNRVGPSPIPEDEGPLRFPIPEDEGPSRFLCSTNPSSDTEFHLSPIPEVLMKHGEDAARRTMNTSSSENDSNFERRTKFRQDHPHPIPPPQKPKEVASSRRTKTKIDRLVPTTRKTRDQLASEERTKARHDHPVPPTQNREDGTFTTRLHYNGVIEADEEGCGRQYVNGEVEYIHKCDPDRWSKLEVDDVLEKLGIDVSRLEYFYRKPRMSLEDGMVRLFDNKSALDMAEIGVEVGVIDVYSVEVGGVVIDAPDVLVSQLTQEQIQSPVRESVAREMRFEGPQFQDGLIASESDSEEDGHDGVGKKNQEGEEDWLVQSEEFEDEEAVDIVILKRVKMRGQLILKRVKGQ
ncbi:hypothetical protein AAHA92_00466 [Salvia divinorum]|uniref:PB1-like domain-containing protein n=1 Tax=Salvia divinorum TaxID=28513 RepID=A0ABD1IKQ7_SALDI